MRTTPSGLVLPWGQDPEIKELIEHLDHRSEACYDPYLKRSRIELLNRSEYDEVAKQIGMCTGDFTYAARNYFQIVTKKGEETPFALWESQDLVLEKMLQMRSKGMAQRIMIIKARQLGMCLIPKTLVLTADLRWIPIDDTKPGDELVSVDEHHENHMAGRKMRKAVVLARRDVYEESYRLTMEDGRELIATGGHRFLCRKRGSVSTAWVSVKKSASGKTTAPIVPGDYIRNLVRPWKAEGSMDDGWFGGLIDGEGNARKKERAGSELCVCQVPGRVLNHARKYLGDNSYKFREDIDIRKGTNSKIGKKPVHRFVIGDFPGILRLIGSTRPDRFIDANLWEGKSLPKDRTGSAPSWVKVISVEPLGKQRMVDLQTTTKTFIAEGFVSHNSTLIEALIAWRTMFFPRARGIVVSDDSENSAELFSKMLFIYDHMPWWLQPMLDRRKEEKLLVFDNPDDSKKRTDPGLQSRVSVQAATKITGVGQGRTLNCVHLSEYADWPDAKAVEIIQEDIHNAIADDVDTFAFLESTAKGAGRYAHKLWRKQVSLRENAQWYPLFLPWFFERGRQKSPPRSWKMDQKSLDMRERASRDWVKCTNCGLYNEQGALEESLVGFDCATCKVGVMEPVILSDRQLYWMHNEFANIAIDQKSKKTLSQEMCLTAEEAFQISGYQIFPQECIDFVEKSIQQFSYTSGHFDERGNYHAMRSRKLPDGSKKKECRIDGCPYDHTHDINNLRVWEEPLPGYSYVVGADVAEGLSGDADYSVAFVNRICPSFGSPDVHVATFRSNEVDPISFGDLLNFLGLWYNEALMSIEINKFDSCFTRVKQYHQYPNNYRWKHVDSTNQMTNKWGWVTTQITKPRLWQTAVSFLKQRLWIVRSDNFHEELLTFQKESPEDRGASAEDSFKDDEIMAGMIALYTSHDLDWNEDQQSIPMATHGGINASDQWVMRCGACGYTWSASSPQAYPRCPNDKTGPAKDRPCRSVKLSGTKIERAGDLTEERIDWATEIGEPIPRNSKDYTPTYDEL